MSETEAPSDPAKKPSVITPIKDGPLRVQGLETFEGADGPMDAQPEMAASW
jgi:hypothetical protein